jgi:hypothetical protein
MKEVLPFKLADVAGLSRPRYGNANPERVDNPFWDYMIRQRRWAYWARKQFDIKVEFQSRASHGHRWRDEPGGPVWCFTRFGRSVTVLDFTTVYVAGEHEDSYDPDFCIYNDVIVEDSQGNLEIFLYPADIFPPTDFHTATLIDNQIWLIGSLGYPALRRIGETQVMRLDTNSFAMEAIETNGDGPGWISRHQAGVDHQGKEIWIKGGKICTEKDYVDNTGVFVLSLETRRWRRVS